MYHCHIIFYLAGLSCNECENIKKLSPFEKFTHEFIESDIPNPSLTAKADVILADLHNSDVKASLHTLITNKSKDSQLIVLIEKEQFTSVSDNLSEITDIWTLPMSGEEVQFHFLKWQNDYKMKLDFWQTSHYFESTINSIPNLIWYKDKNGIHKKVNDSFCKTVNKTHEQVEGRDHYYIWDVDPDDPANRGYDCMESDLEVINSKKTCVSEELVNTKDGTKLLTTYKSPLYDLDGSVMGTVGVGIDITQERAYEQEIIKKNHSLETIFTSIDCGILCHSIDGTQILNINKTALDILGYESLDEIMAAGFNMISPSVLDEDKPQLRECIEMLKNEGDSVSIEYRVKHRNGEILHVTGNVKLLKENGELFYQRFLLDCTKQKALEKQTERHNMEMLQALSMDYNLVCFFNLDTGMGIPLRVDDNNLLGDAFKGNNISLSESLEYYNQKLVFEDDKDMFGKVSSLENLRKEMSRKKQYYVNFRTFIDNQIYYYEMKVVRAGNLEDSHGIILGFCSVNDKTRYEMQQKKLLEDALTQANKANKAKSVFLSNMSHDIRTPMNAIVGFTALATRHIDCKEKVMEYLKKITSSGNHLLNLINDVLDMSHIESGKVHLEEMPCSMTDIVNGLSNIVQADIQAKHHTFHIDTVNISDEQFYCDKLRLNQVLLNVISNSIKYTNNGGHIYLRVTEKDGASVGYANYEFYVKDTGLGMSKEFIAHLFEPFEREKNTTASGIQGTGLGMAITKNIVEMMNGNINVTSEQGVGTEVTLSFTFRLNTEAENSTDISEPDTDKELIPSEINLCNERILLVEDNELNQEIATAILSDAGFKIDVAENGQIAVDIIKKSVPGYYRLVLMDVQMPVMNGYEATVEIRKLENENLSSIPILAMTANAFEEDKQRALEAGMNGHITKPIDVEKLFDELKRILK